MIHNLYTVLQDLARDKDKELTALIEDLSGRVQVGSMAYSGRYQNRGTQNRNLISFICPSAPKPIERPVARDKVKDILNAIKRGETCSDQSAQNIMASYLTETGVAEFLKFLVNKGTKTDEEFAENFASQPDLQDLFKGMPAYEIVVRDDLGQPAKRGEQRLKIFLIDRRTNMGSEIKFPNNDCLLLYLWFLMYPRQEMTKYNIKSQFLDIAEMAHGLYQNPTTIDNKIVVNKKGEREVSEKGFEDFFTKNLNKINNAVRAAKKDPNADDGWYIICSESQENNDSHKYSISLTKEFIKLPMFLESLRQQYQKDPMQWK